MSSHMFHFDEPSDKPMMKTLLKLRNMRLIEVEWVPGDIRYTSETPFSVKKHLNVRVTDPNVELHFPTVGEPQAWTGYNTNPIHSDFRSLLKEPLPLTSKDHWNNVCPLCIQTGIWGHVVHDSIDVDTICFVGCQECVKKNQWTWGTVKINDKNIDSGHQFINKFANELNIYLKMVLRNHAKLNIWKQLKSKNHLPILP